MPTTHATKFVSNCMSAYRSLEASKKYAGPKDWARVHDVQSRLATALGLRRAINAGPRKERKRRKPRAVKKAEE